MGANPGITRRDFLNGALLGAGALLLDLQAPLHAFALAQANPEFTGEGDYAASNGNTPEVTRAFRDIENGRYLSGGDIRDTGELYDLIIVGGGLSGLGAAYEFSRTAPRKAKCLILENHPVFGGAAKRNEFVVDGVRLIGPQASNAFGVIDRPDIPGYDIYSDLGVPTEFEYGELPSGMKPLDFDPTNFGFRLWFDSPSIGNFFPRAGTEGKGAWAAGFWNKDLAGTPYTGKVRNDFLRWRSITGKQHDGPDYEKWLDSMTYKQYIEKVLALSPEITRYADPVLASVVGLGCDAISAYAARQVSMPGFPEFRGLRSLQKSHWHSFPGGNDGFSRALLKAVLPEAIEGSSGFAAVQDGRIRFDRLDMAGKRVRLRLGASVVRVEQGVKSITLRYLKDGAVYQVNARAAVMACGSRVTRKVVAGLPEDYKAAYANFRTSPILVANVALTNWQFLYRLGFTACKWPEGFGFGCNMRKPMYIGNYRPPLAPDKPNLLTFYVSFHEPGLPAEEQGEKGRAKMLSTSYAEFESQILGQMKTLFSDSGFRVDKDVAGIVLNRWTYAYVNPQPGFYYGRDGKPAPRDVIRKPLGRIAFGHAELNGHQHWVAAVEEGRRAVRQAMAAL